MLLDEGLELLDEGECLALLAGARVGRVGVTISGLPVILPVNYRFISGAILFRTGEGTKLHAASRHAVMAFEVDDYDHTSRRGWSVLAIGRAEHVRDAGEYAALDGLVPASWAGNESRRNLVRMSPEVLTGRRIASD